MGLLALFGQSLWQVGHGLLSIGGGILWVLWFVLLPSQMPMSTLWFLLFLAEGKLPTKSLRRERVAKLIIVLAAIVMLVMYLAAFHATRLYFGYDPLGMASAANDPPSLMTTVGVLLVIGVVGAAADLLLFSWALSAGRGY